LRKVSKRCFDLIQVSPRIEINSEEEADEAARDFKTSIASAYMLSTSKVTLSDINNHDLPGNTSRDYENWGKKLGIQRVNRQSVGSRKP
jgi:hypothetical protein